MKIISKHIVEEPDFRPFRVSIEFETERDVLMFLKEVYDIEYIQTEGVNDNGEQFPADEIRILKQLEEATIAVSGSPAWKDRVNHKKK